MGLVGLDSIDAAAASAELSFLLHERFWGQGYATEATARHPVTLNSLPRQSEATAGQPSTLRSPPFAVLLRRTGQPSTAAVQEGLRREFACKGDAFHDVVVMALLRKAGTKSEDRGRNPKGIRRPRLGRERLLEEFPGCGGVHDERAEDFELWVERLA